MVEGDNQLQQVPLTPYMTTQCSTCAHTTASLHTQNLWWLKYTFCLVILPWAPLDLESFDLLVKGSVFADKSLVLVEDLNAYGWAQLGITETEDF